MNPEQSSSHVHSSLCDDGRDCGYAGTGRHRMEQTSSELHATLTVEIYKLSPDPRSPRWKFEARFTDGLTGPLGVGRGETFAEAIRGAARQLHPTPEESRS